MRRSGFSEEQIAMALRRVEAGTPVGEVCRKLGISQGTIFRRKKAYGGLGCRSCVSSGSYGTRTVG